MPVRRKRVEELAAEVLRASNVTKPPVPIETIARHHGLVVRSQPLQSDLSGFLYRDDRQPVVGVNSSHRMVRRRFTIAHELGHFLLHQSHKLRVDRSVLARLRGSTAEDTIDVDEVEANRFAAAVLMPTELLKGDLAQLRPMDILHDEDDIKTLARRYGVSAQALLLRLDDLGYLER